MATFDVSLYEPIHPGWTADSTAVTADSALYTADGGPLVGATEVNDAVVNANFVFANVYEPVARPITADDVTHKADSTAWTADGGPLEGARDFSDAEVIPAIIELPIGGYAAPRRPRAVVGYGYGVLPRLEGEAHGVVYAIGGRGEAVLQLTGAAVGEVGDDIEVLLLMLLAA
jgi:hypothetical protein